MELLAILLFIPLCKFMFRALCFVVGGALQIVGGAIALIGNGINRAESRRIAKQHNKQIEQAQRYKYELAIEKQRERRIKEAEKRERDEQREAREREKFDWQREKMDWLRRKEQDRRDELERKQKQREQIEKEKREQEKNNKIEKRRLACSDMEHGENMIEHYGAIYNELEKQKGNTGSARDRINCLNKQAAVLNKIHKEAQRIEKAKYNKYICGAK